MHWSELEPADQRNLNQIRLGAFILLSLITGVFSFFWCLLLRDGYVSAIGATYTFYSLVAYIIVSDIVSRDDSDLWNEILHRPGQWWARIPLALILMCGLIVVGICKILWWTGVYVGGHLYARTREYHHETRDALRVWLKLQWWDAPFQECYTARDLFWYWAYKRDDPRTRQQILEEQRQQHITDAKTELDRLTQIQSARMEVEGRTSHQDPLS